MWHSWPQISEPDTEPRKMMCRVFSSLFTSSISVSIQYRSCCRVRLLDYDTNVGAVKKKKIVIKIVDIRKCIRVLCAVCMYIKIKNETEPLEE